MKKLNRICLYLSSFSPLFLLIIFKEIIEIINKNWSLNFLNIFLLIIVFVLLNFGFWGLIINLIKLKKEKGKKVKVIYKSNTTDQHFLGYFSIFVLFAITFEIEMYSMAIIFFLVIVFIGIVYIRNDMYYINPLLNILGYSFYQITTQEDKEEKQNVYYKGALRVDGEYYLVNTYKNFLILKDKI